MATDQRLLTPEGPLQQLRQAFSGGFGPNNLHFSCFLFPVWFCSVGLLVIAVPVDYPF
jgi:hypothetical protein